MVLRQNKNGRTISLFANPCQLSAVRNMKRFLAYCTLILVSASGFGQTNQKTITISGRVNTEKKLQLSDLQKFALQNIGDVPISNHAGEIKGTAKAMKGILLRELL